MTDILERLRVGPVVIYAADVDLMNEAADEIKHLRHEIADYQRIVRTAEPGDNRISAAELERIAQAEEIERLRAEVEELRARVKDLEGVIKWGQGF